MKQHFFEAVANVPAFEVVSVKAHRSKPEGHRVQIRPGGRIMVTNAQRPSED